MTSRFVARTDSPTTPLTFIVGGLAMIAASLAALLMREWLVTSMIASVRAWSAMGPSGALLVAAFGAAAVLLAVAWRRSHGVRTVPLAIVGLLLIVFHRAVWGAFLSLSRWLVDQAWWVTYIRLGVVPLSVAGLALGVLLVVVGLLALRNTAR